MIYGNVKALVPLCREKLKLEFDRKSERPRYRRGEMLPLNESLIFGIVTRSQVGHIPSVDISFTENESTFIRDSYVFKSLVSSNLHKQQQLENVFNNSEHVDINVEKEIKHLREYGDYSHEAIKHEMVDQYVQVGTLEELETFHLFLMNDLYREEKAINFEEAFSQGREIDKKYYFVPLKLDTTSSQLTYRIDRDLMKYVVQLNKNGYRASQVSVLEELANIPSEDAKRTYLK